MISDKLKFAIKASLSLVIVTLFSFAMGWTQSSVAIITILIIASVGSVGDSVSKGILRVIGTIIGAMIGLTLIAIFPQSRELYLIALSIFVSITLYLARAYRGDNSIFMLTAITMMMMFQNGDASSSFLYGIDKTFMTVFGIATYTLVGIFLWPVSIQDETIKKVTSLSQAQHALFDAKYNSEESAIVWQKLMDAESNLIASSHTHTDNTLKALFSEEAWQTIIKSHIKIDALLIRLSNHSKESFEQQSKKNILNYAQANQEIGALFDAITVVWETQEEIAIPQQWTPQYQTEHLKELPHLMRASLITMGRQLASLHHALCEIASIINRSLSPVPTLFETTKTASVSHFVWWDSEDMKGALLSFCIFWFATFLWITINPPAGFLIVTLATGMSVLTTFSTIKPSLLMIVFTLSFAFASFMYIAVLPHIQLGWELGIFIFTYGMIGFYLMPPKLSLFFLLGIMTLGLSNEMQYNFDVFLITLFVFYAFLSLLLLFYYIPFSTKPESLFLRMKQRFFTLAIPLSRVRQRSWIDNIKSNYSSLHLMPTVKKMQLWESQLDQKYFDTIEFDTLSRFTQESETLAYLILLMHQQTKQNKNPLIEEFNERYPLQTLEQTLMKHTVHCVARYDTSIKDTLVQKAEKALESFLSTIHFSDYSYEEIASFYESINLKESIWISLFTCEQLISELHLEQLKKERF